MTKQPSQGWGQAWDQSDSFRTALILLAYDCLNFGAIHHSLCTWLLWPGHRAHKDKVHVPALTMQHPDLAMQPTRREKEKGRERRAKAHQCLQSCATNGIAQAAVTHCVLVTTPQRAAIRRRMEKSVQRDGTFVRSRAAFRRIRSHNIQEKLLDSD